MTNIHESLGTLVVSGCVFDKSIACNVVGTYHGMGPIEASLQHASSALV